MAVEKLQTIFRTVFEDEKIVLRPDLAAKDVKRWDSFNHINLMIAIEEDFGVVLEPNEVQKARTVGDLVETLRRKGCDLSW